MQKKGIIKNRSKSSEGKVYNAFRENDGRPDLIEESNL